MQPHTHSRLQPDWTCHLYVTADNNLFKVVESDVTQFGTADPRKVKLVVQIDVPGGRVQRYVTNDNGHFFLHQEIPATKDNLDTGTVRVLRNFLVASRRLRTGDSTALIMYGHGTGFTKFKIPRE